MANEQNLKPFPKGVSGNPAGRTPGSVSVKAELQKLAALALKGEHNFLTEDFEDMPVARKIALNLMSKAVADSDLASIIKVMEYLDGKPLQPTENKHEHSGAMTVERVFYGDKKE